MRRIIVLVGLLLLVIGVVGSIMSFHRVTQASVVKDERTIPDHFNQLVLQSDNAEVDIEPSSDSVTKISLSGTVGNNHHYKLNTKINDQTLNVTLDNNQLNLINFDFISQHLVLTISLPEKEYEKLQLNNNNGKLQVENINSNQINAITHNGLVILSHTTSKKVDAESNNGKVELTYVEGDLTGKTDNGMIQVTAKDLNRNIDFHCSNGKIDIKTDQEPTNNRFQVHVDNGKINILNKYKSDAVIGNGDYLITLSTSNGSIDVKQN